jgi:hypothetical protein
MRWAHARSRDHLLIATLSAHWRMLLRRHDPNMPSIRSLHYPTGPADVPVEGRSIGVALLWLERLSGARGARMHPSAAGSWRSRASAAALRDR